MWDMTCLESREGSTPTLGCSWGPHPADDQALTRPHRPDTPPGPHSNWKQRDFCLQSPALGSVWSWSIMLHANLLKSSRPHHSSKGFVSFSINPSFEKFIAQLVFITLRWKLPYKISDQKHFFSLANTKYHLKQIFVSRFRVLVRTMLFPECFGCAAQNFCVKIYWIQELTNKWWAILLDFWTTD